jgi:putative aldouronate transport system permease protein
MTKTPTSAKSSLRRNSRRKTLMLTTMILPGAIWLILLKYLPMGGIVLAFKKYQIYFQDPGFINNILHSAWSGFDNFRFLFAGTNTWNIIRNTLGYNIVFIIVGIVIPVAFAIMLAEITRKRITKIYQTMMFFPFFLSWVVVSYFLLAFLDPGAGLVTRMQEAAGGTATQWYADPAPWPWLLLLAQEWKNVGYTCIMYLATITGIDTTQYEAARIDGASKWQQVRYITIPHLRPIIVILFIVNVGRIFNSDFGLFFTVPRDSGQLYPATQVMDVFVYKALLQSNDIGMSAAAGLFQSAMGFILILIANAIVNKIDPDSAMF